MKAITVIAAAVLFGLSLPLSAAAMSHEKGELEHGQGHEKMEHQGHGAMEHGGMMMEGDMVMLGESTENGIKAMAHLKDVKAAMSKMGMTETHHFMVMFMDTATGKPVESGMAAIKIKGPDGMKSEPIKLMGMEGHFGADVTLAAPGRYEFEIGTKLADGKKRNFQFEYSGN
ncbi:hypothetical protein DESUT3_21480 [Desulfuromonas versatilis]|uniref:YtkA-like domain-containing protein n=1 Tax=Desulfuromonas versatilis TaxID=2802975 RepID=A0ABM8HVG6_9BACT|nr:hypothetical protein [Desulfuromonas versatilis]BCR05079.1 hypothetical protein DESUT3_21480 [Desulfuromonas versatilis]